MAKKRVVVLYGGRADEHSISCISTAGVLGAMDTERFEPIPVGITKDGKWIINGEDPRGWNLDGGELPTVKITPESRPVMLDPSRGQDGFQPHQFRRFRLRHQLRQHVRPGNAPCADLPWPCGRGTAGAARPLWRGRYGSRPAGNDGCAVRGVRSVCFRRLHG